LLPAIEAARLMTEAQRLRNEGATELAVFAKSTSTFPSMGGELGLRKVVDVARALAGRADPAPDDRATAEEVWLGIANRDAAARACMVKQRPELCSWALVERICTASRDAATDSAKAALRLALLALRVARLLRLEPYFALQLEGYAFVHIANAWRVIGKLRRAGEAFSRGIRFWEAGRATRFPLLPGWRVLDLEVSLRRAERQFQEAIVLVDRALAAAPREAWARILLNKATVFDQQGDPAAAVAVLHEAAPELELAGDAGLVFRWQSMLVAALANTGRYEDAKLLLPGALAMSKVLGGALDRLRLTGVSARIAAGLGRRVEALEAFAAVRKEFRRLEMAYDYALVSLEAGEVLLKEGRHREVETLASEMHWIFEREKVHPEAEKALALFRKAAEGRTATPELASRVVRFLREVQRNPELAFAA
jgi:tetratricopeptide (TPR) repeat protein